MIVIISSSRGSVCPVLAVIKLTNLLANFVQPIL